MTTATLDTAAFARAVRAALSDLPPEELDDLTDGLEADLAERASDEDSADFGDPVAYANELRASAGLDPRSRERASTLGGAFGAAGRELSSDLKRIYAHPFVTKVAAFFVSLRPVWWMFRAWVFYLILCWVCQVPMARLTFISFILGLGALVVSVQFGRGRWLPRSWMRKTLLAVNVILVLLVPVIIIGSANLFGAATTVSYAADVSPASRALTYDGHEVTNIFAYDASGNPLTNVQLFDQHGKPLYTVADPDHQTTSNFPYFYVPNNSVVGRPGWNVYPLLHVPQSELTDQSLPKPGAIAQVVKPHAATVPPLAAPAPAPTATATPSPSPTSSPTPTPTPTHG
jgi:hypothetical protein